MSYTLGILQSSMVSKLHDLDKNIQSFQIVPHIAKL